ncbi:MAG: carbohydrate ABC transporter permease [Flexilinea sp.]
MYPLVVSIFPSFKAILEIFKSFTAFPTQFRYQNYITAWKVGNIGRYFFNTIVLSLGTLALSAFIGAMASYVLSKFYFKAISGVYLFFISGLMIPIQAVLIPLSYVFGKLGITNNYPMLILLYSGFCLPMTVLMLTGFMKSIPAELEKQLCWMAPIHSRFLYTLFFRSQCPELSVYPSLILFRSGTIYCFL